MTGSVNIDDRKPGVVGILIRHPAVWAVFTVAVAGAAAYLHLRGPETSVQAFYVSGFAVLAFAGAAWTLGASHGGDAASRMLLSAADAAGDGLLITAPDGRIVYDNPAFHRLFEAAATTAIPPSGLRSVASRTPASYQTASETGFRRH